MMKKTERVSFWRFLVFVAVFGFLVLTSTRSFAKDLRVKGMRAFTTAEIQGALKSVDLDQVWKAHQRKTDPTWDGVAPWPIKLGFNRLVIRRGVQWLAEGFCAGARCDGLPCALSKVPEFKVRAGSVYFAENIQCTDWWRPHTGSREPAPIALPSSEPGPKAAEEVQAVLSAVDQSNRAVQLLPDNQCKGPGETRGLGGGGATSPTQSSAAQGGPNGRPNGGPNGAPNGGLEELPPDLDTCKIPSELKSAEGTSFLEQASKKAWDTTCFFGLTAVNMGIDWVLDPPAYLKVKKEGKGEGSQWAWQEFALEGCKRFLKGSGLAEMTKKRIADRLHELRTHTVHSVHPALVPEKDRVELDNGERLEILKQLYHKLLQEGAILPENTASIGKLMELAEATLNRDAAKKLYKIRPGLPKNLDNTKIIDHLEKILSLPTTSSPVNQARMREVFDEALENYSPEIKAFGKKLRDKLIRDSMAPVTDKVPRKTVVFLGGEPGTGKTQLVQSIAKAMGKPYFEFLATGMTAEKLIAKIDDCLIHSDDLMPVIFIDEASDVLNRPELAAGKNGPVKGGRTDVAAVLLPVTEKKQVKMRSPYLSEGIEGLKLDISHNMKRPVIFFAGNGEITEDALKNRLWANVWFPAFSLDARRKIAHQKFSEKLTAFGIDPGLVTKEHWDMVETIVQVDHQHSAGARTLDDSIDDYVRYLSDAFNPLEGSDADQEPFDPTARYPKTAAKGHAEESDDESQEVAPTHLKGKEEALPKVKKTGKVGKPDKADKRK